MKYITSIFLIVLFTSCGSRIQKPNTKIANNLEILNYLKENNLKAEKTESGLYYTIHKAGKGKFPIKKSTVRTYYKGYLLNGKVFDKTDFRGTLFKLKEVIAGLREGFSLIKSGSEATFFIPSQLAYGKNGTDGIPKNAVVIFHVKLIGVY